MPGKRRYVHPETLRLRRLQTEERLTSQLLAFDASDADDRLEAIKALYGEKPDEHGFQLARQTVSYRAEEELKEIWGGLESGRITIDSRRSATTRIFEYIEVYYNRQRKHSAIGHQIPMLFEQKSP